ncbi:hypothetical protein FRB97_005540 [Tulasnella sp. 331]|nr:hypothetical protein FRB97_005540 [Tulasnella sp. 331]
MDWHREGSSVLGCMSIACWTIVFAPQIYENYSLQSGEGLSLYLVLIWFLGDVLNLFGSVMAGLLPTVTLLAAYYILSDIILFFQIFYYRRRAQYHQSKPQTAHDERDPLLVDSSTAPKANSQSIFFGRAALYFYAALFVSLTGVVAFVVNRAEETPNPTDPTHGGSNEDIIEWKSQLFGWSSALLYCGSRIPQIIKNAKTKCVGLSPGMFIFALCGNLTYFLSILVASTSNQHLIANASWLTGSAVTMFSDLIVLYQFFLYRSMAQQASG